MDSGPGFHILWKEEKNKDYHTPCWESELLIWIPSCCSKSTWEEEWRKRLATTGMHALYTTRNTDHPGQNELPDIVNFHVNVLKHLCSQSHLKQHLNSTKDFEHSLLLYLIFLPSRISFQNSTDTLATSSITAMSFKIILFQNSHNYLFLFQANDFWLCWQINLHCTIWKQNHLVFILIFLKRCRYSPPNLVALVKGHYLCYTAGCIGRNVFYCV